MRKQLILKYYILQLLVICVFISPLSSVEKSYVRPINDEIELSYVFSSNVVLEEWKNPGLYSPVNMFDGDINTCFAEAQIGRENTVTRNNSIECSAHFKNSVYIDEIRIINGYGKSAELFKNNNRIKKIGLTVPYIGPLWGDINIYILEDTSEVQSIKLDKSYLVSIIQIRNDGSDDSIYKGDKFDDTCITEISFYNQGQKIPVKNINKAKKEYLQRIQQKLLSLFPPKSARKNRWLVKDNKLFRKANEEWVLKKYYFTADDEIKTFDEKGNCTRVTENFDNLECQE